MNQKEKDSNLFAEFPPVPTEQWEEQIKKDLKGADYKKKLVWRTREGFEIKPYYRREDTASLDHLDTYPGDFPYTRGNAVKKNEWRIRQDIPVEDIKSANKKALDILMKGIDSVGFVFREDDRPTTDKIELLLENIYAEAVEMNFIQGDAHKIIAIVEELAKKYNRDLGKIYGSVDCDPLGDMLRTGKLFPSEDKVMESTKNMVKATELLPNFDAITVHADIIKNAGATVVQELAYGLAMGAEYITKLTEKELTVDEVAPKIRFNMATGPVYFMEIAKHRAARNLWANIVNAYGPSNADHTRMTIHSKNAAWNKTLYDPYVNMLRTTTETMSMALGGVNSISVMPFNEIFEKPNEFSERIARNQQILLKEESYFNKVADIGAGSYYIENLTDALAESAWKVFLQIQDQGGFIAAFRNGFVQKHITEAAQKRDMALASRKETLLGTNQYPGFSEHITPEVNYEVFEPKNMAAEDAEAEALTLADRLPLRWQRLPQGGAQGAPGGHRPARRPLPAGRPAPGCR
jgi:methylmalonyl-CoA mutase